jgi:hypothetical protein
MKNIALFTLVVLAGSLTAQTRMDRDHPLPLPPSGEITGHIAENDKGEAYYAFAAGPGPVVVTVDITPIDANINVDINLYDRNNRSILAMNPRAYNDKSVREQKRIVLPKAERLVMRVGRNHYGGSGSFRVRVEGFANSGATPLELPSKGTLRLLMKDGKTIEVDLTEVRDAKVLPPR